MLALEEARTKILAEIQPLGGETVSLEEALNRVLAEKIIAPIDLPGFDNSAMDGCAVRAEDVAQASLNSPARLKLCGRIEAGEISEARLKPGACVRVFTGSALPAGADAVVMQEDTRVEPQAAGEVLVLDKAERGENVRRRGEDVKRGQEVFESGDSLGVGAIGLLAALGLKEVGVARAPVVGLLATGSELREAGEPLVPGMIYESNRQMLAPLVARAGAISKIFPPARDTLEGTCLALENAFGQCDAVVTTGGVSVGELDYVKAAFERLGGQLEFWKVAMRPGKPFAFGRWGGKFLFGLPGNPVSAMVTFLILVWPALRRWQGAREVELPGHPGILAARLVNDGERPHFFRVRVDAAGRVRGAGRQGSHILSGLAKANGLVKVGPGSALEIGAPVQVLRWDF